MNNNKIVSVFLAATLVSISCSAAAQPLKKIPRIGYLAADSRAPTRDAFRQGLRDLGYLEGQSILIEWRFAEGKSKQFPEYVSELVRLKLDVIVAGNANAVAALKHATATTPIVIASYPGDPVADGIVTSFARPGGNITGVIPLSPELSGKQLEVLKEALPKLSRLAVMWNPDASGTRSQWHETQAAARSLGLQCLSLEVRAPDDIDKAMATAQHQRADALIVLRDQLTYLVRNQIVAKAEKIHLPGMYPIIDFVEAGGLMSYGASNDAQYRRAATFVAKILKGTKPADLPLEAPTKFEFVINLKAAKQISLTIPPNVLARADKVIR